MTDLVKQKKDASNFLKDDNLKLEVAKVLPKHVTAERLMRVALTAVMNSPNLLAAVSHPIGKASLLNALMTCSQAGLEPDGRLAHLVPFWSGKNKCYIVQVIFDYKGLTALALRNGYESVYADKVCENDDFDCGVINGHKALTHKINWKGERGDVYAYYAINLRNGVLDFEVMSVAEVESVRKRSRAADEGPWITDPFEMGKKSVLRRFSKRWDLLPEIRDVIYADDDTPPPLSIEAKASTPLFTDKGNAPQLTEGKPKPTAADKQLKKLRTKLEKARLSEADLTGFLAEIGVIGNGIELEQAIEADDNLLPMLIDQFDDMARKVAMAQAHQKGGDTTQKELV